MAVKINFAFILFYCKSRKKYIGGWGMDVEKKSRFRRRRITGFSVLDVVKKKVVMKDVGDSLKQGGVYAFAFKNRIHIGPFTTQFVGKPCDRTLLAVKFLFYQASNVYHDKWELGRKLSKLYSSSPVGTLKLNAKSVRTVFCLSSYLASRIAYGVDKQQPLTLARYIVLPFGIAYIHSVSVVATHPTPHPILREFDKKDEFNNALMSDNLTEISNKGTKKR